jgi:hypothetical protein
MKQGNLSLKIVYKPLDTYKNVTVRSGSNRQNYNANTRYFEPDRRIDPYVVLVQCGVNDVHNIVSGLVNSNLTDVSWKQSTPAGYKEILTTDKEFKIGTGADKGKLTIFKNVSDLEPVTILFTARFMDNKTNRVVNFQESFNLITLPIAESPVLLETSAPVGYNLFPTENNQGLICQADLYRGKDKVPAAYWWYNGQYEIGNVEGYQGQYSNKLFIDASKINKSGTIIKAEVADCSEYLNQLIEQKVEADTQVVEWRGRYQTQGVNFIKKSSQLFLDGKLSYLTKIDVIAGKRCLVFESSNDIAYLGDSGYFLEAEKKYTFSFYARSNIQSLDIGRVYINADNKGFLSGEMIGNSWKRYSFTFIAEGNRGVNVHFYPKIKKTDGTYNSFYVTDWKLEKETLSDWSPSKEDLQDLINQKTELYKSNTSLPENYRPSSKPSKLYTADFMLMKKLPAYTEEILYPTSVSPEASSVQVEMVLNTNNGIIQQPEHFLSVGWLKQANGTFKYKGFKVNISIADIKALNEANKQLDYELREDVTLKP